MLWHFQLGKPQTGEKHRLAKLHFRLYCLFECVEAIDNSHTSEETLRQLSDQHGGSCIMERCRVTGPLALHLESILVSMMSALLPFYFCEVTSVRLAHGTKHKKSRQAL